MKKNIKEILLDIIIIFIWFIIFSSVILFSYFIPTIILRIIGVK